MQIEILKKSTKYSIYNLLTYMACSLVHKHLSDYKYHNKN